MRVAIASDHVGFGLKATIIETLEQDDHAVLDLGTHGPAPVDYPPMARAVATAVGKNFVDRGILLCSNGTGGAIVANRFSGIRAAATSDPALARESREQLDANFLSVSAANLTRDALVALVTQWMSAEFARTDQAAGVLAAIAEVAGTPVPRGTAPGRRSRHSAPSGDTSTPAAAPAPAAAAVEHPPATDTPKASDITAVMKVMASVKEPEVKAIATRLLQFIRNRFPTAAGTPTEHGFAFTLEDQHVASVIIGKDFVELEAGPDRVSTSKIRDVDRLDLLLDLPSVTKSFDRIKM